MGEIVEIFSLGYSKILPPSVLRDYVKEPGLRRNVYRRSPEAKLCVDRRNHIAQQKPNGSLSDGALSHKVQK